MSWFPKRTLYLEKHQYQAGLPLVGCRKLKNSQLGFNSYNFFFAFKIIRQMRCLLLNLFHEINFKNNNKHFRNISKTSSYGLFIFNSLYYRCHLSNFMCLL